jgi:hypothetical protein
MAAGRAVFAKSRLFQTLPATCSSNRATSQFKI